MTRAAPLLALLTLGCAGLIEEPPGVDGPRAAAGPRHTRRLSAPQLQQAIYGATGFHYIGRARVVDHNAPQGSEVRDDARLLEVYGASLGNPDYNYTVRASLEPSITFSKLAEDGVRYVCGEVARAEVIDGGHPSGEPHLLLTVDGDESLPADEPAIRANIAALGLQYWGLVLTADDEDPVALVDVYRAGYDAAVGAPADDPDAPPADATTAERSAAAWRAVCIAMMSDPRFLAY